MKNLVKFYWKGQDQLYTHSFIQQMFTLCQLSIKFQILCGKGNAVSALWGLEFRYHSVNGVKNIIINTWRSTCFLSWKYSSISVLPPMLLSFEFNLLRSMEGEGEGLTGEMWLFALLFPIRIECICILM